MFNKRGTRSRNVSHSSGRLFRFKNFLVRVDQIRAIAEADVRKLRHDPYELLTRMIQPAIWLLIFGQAMARTRMITDGSLPYLDYLAPGILAQSILFIAIFYGISLIWERDMGILHKLLVTPAPRSILVIGRALSAGVRALSQMVIVYFLSFLLDVHLRWEWLPLMGVCAMVVLGAAIFSTFSLIVASIVKKRERFMGIGQILTMPLFFASNALYPIDLMPQWLQLVSFINPLTYQVDALRSFMVTGAESSFGLWIDFMIGLGVFAILVCIAAKMYPKILY